jgi:hypothetical protein
MAENEANGNEEVDVHKMFLLHIGNISKGQETLSKDFKDLRREVGDRLEAHAANARVDITRVHTRIDDHEKNFHRPASSPRQLSVSESIAKWATFVTVAAGGTGVILWLLYCLHKAVETGVIK